MVEIYLFILIWKRWEIRLSLYSIDIEFTYCILPMWQRTVKTYQVDRVRKTDTIIQILPQLSPFFHPNYFPKDL